MNDRCGATGTRHDPGTVELQPIGAVVPDKVEGAQEIETRNRDDTPTRNVRVRNGVLCRGS